MGYYCRWHVGLRERVDVFCAWARYCFIIREIHAAAELLHKRRKNDHVLFKTLAVCHGGFLKDHLVGVKHC